MSFTLILNSSNVVNSLNNQYQYNFIGGGFQIKEGTEITLTQAQIPYSFYNVNATLYGNATFSYAWPSATLANTYDIYPCTLPDGYYSTNDLSLFLQSQFVLNNQYLIETSSGNPLFFMGLLTNISAYADQILVFNVPTTLPAGYSEPNGVGSFPFPVSSLTPSLIITTQPFGTLIGFKVGAYPQIINPALNTADQSFLSNTTPNATPVNSIIVRCNLVSNNVSIPSDVMDSFAVTGAFGSNINYSPSFEHFVSLKSGTYSNLIITLVSQDFQTIAFRDPNVLITLLIQEHGIKKTNK